MPRTHSTSWRPRTAGFCITLSLIVKQLQLFSNEINALKKNKRNTREGWCIKATQLETAVGDREQRARHIDEKVMRLRCVETSSAKFGDAAPTQT